MSENVEQTQAAVVVHDRYADVNELFRAVTEAIRRSQFICIEQRWRFLMRVFNEFLDVREYLSAAPQSCTTKAAEEFTHAVRASLYNNMCMDSVAQNVVLCLSDFDSFYSTVRQLRQVATSSNGRPAHMMLCCIYYGATIVMDKVMSLHGRDAEALRLASIIHEVTREINDLRGVAAAASASTAGSSQSEK